MSDPTGTFEPMPCDDGEHLFWPGTAAEVRKLADRPGAKVDLRQHWPCALCLAQVPLLVEEMARRRQRADSPDRR